MSEICSITGVIYLRFDSVLFTLCVFHLNDIIILSSLQFAVLQLNIYLTSSCLVSDLVPSLEEILFMKAPPTIMSISYDLLTQRSLLNVHPKSLRSHDLETFYLFHYSNPRTCGDDPHGSSWAATTVDGCSGTQALGSSWAVTTVDALGPRPCLTCGWLG